ncbi:MAG: hemolysin secretion protein D [Candidatus Melainabacteria bacterium]|nr:MAG: hemolysin secretion protein D [Candidatus Melainabacteria bacterium]RAI10430.1 MAG: hemolysin secretion protein D [Candidatus Melainabacteria bacterium]
MNKKAITGVFFVAVILAIIGCVYAFMQANTMLLQGEVDVKTVDLASKITGRIEKINYKKGDRVKKGDVLIALDTPDINAKAAQVDATVQLALAQQEKVNNGARNEQISMAKASRDLAKKTFDRLNRLHDEGVIPTQKLDEARAKYQAAQDNYNMLVTGSRIEDKLSAAANVKRAMGANDEVQSYLKENTIVAPIDGVITEINVEEGELVGAGYPIVTIVDDNDCWVVFNLREDLLAKIKDGTEFNVKIPAIGKEPVKVRVNYISVMGDFANWRATKAKGDFDMKTFEVRAVPVEKVDGLRAGMSAVFDWKKLK